MMTITRLELAITRHPKGWDVQQRFWYPGTSHPATCNSGGTTLAWALYHGLAPAADSPGQYRLDYITVNGVPLAGPDALQIIERKFGKGRLDWTLPSYRLLLAKEGER